MAKPSDPPTRQPPVVPVTDAVDVGAPDVVGTAGVAVSELAADSIPLNRPSEGVSYGSLKDIELTPALAQSVREEGEKVMGISTQPPPVPPVLTAEKTAEEDFSSLLEQVDSKPVILPNPKTSPMMDHFQHIEELGLAETHHGGQMAFEPTAEVDRNTVDRVKAAFESQLPITDPLPGSLGTSTTSRKVEPVASLEILVAGLSESRVGMSSAAIGNFIDLARTSTVLNIYQPNGDKTTGSITNTPNRGVYSLAGNSAFVQAIKSQSDDQINDILFSFPIGKLVNTARYKFRHLLSDPSLINAVHVFVNDELIIDNLSDYLSHASVDWVDLSQGNLTKQRRATGLCTTPLYGMARVQSPDNNGRLLYFLRHGPSENLGSGEFLTQLVHPGIHRGKESEFEPIPVSHLFAHYFDEEPTSTYVVEEKKKFTQLSLIARAKIHTATEVNVLVGENYVSTSKDTLPNMGIIKVANILYHLLTRAEGRHYVLPLVDVSDLEFNVDTFKDAGEVPIYTPEPFDPSKINNMYQSTPDLTTRQKVTTFGDVSIYHLVSLAVEGETRVDSNGKSVSKRRHFLRLPEGFIDLDTYKPFSLNAQETVAHSVAHSATQIDDVPTPQVNDLKPVTDIRATGDVPIQNPEDVGAVLVEDSIPPAAVAPLPAGHNRIPFIPRSLGITSVEVAAPEPSLAVTAADLLVTMLAPEFFKNPTPSSARPGAITGGEDDGRRYPYTPQETVDNAIALIKSSQNFKTYDPRSGKSGESRLDALDQTTIIGEVNGSLYSVTKNGKNVHVVPLGWKRVNGFSQSNGRAYLTDNSLHTKVAEGLTKGTYTFNLVLAVRNRALALDLGYIVHAAKPIHLAVLRDPAHPDSSPIEYRQIAATPDVVRAYFIEQNRGGRR